MYHTLSWHHFYYIRNSFLNIVLFRSVTVVVIYPRKRDIYSVSRGRVIKYYVNKVNDYTIRWFVLFLRISYVHR